MIKFAPFVEYKMDKCYLTDIECLGPCGLPDGAVGG